MRKEFHVSIHLFPFFSTPELNNTWSIAQAAIPNYSSSRLSMWSLNYPQGLWHCVGEDRTWKKRGPTCCDFLNCLARHVHTSKEILLGPSQQLLLLLPSVRMVARQGLLFHLPRKYQPAQWTPRSPQPIFSWKRNVDPRRELVLYQEHINWLERCEGRQRESAHCILNVWCRKHTFWEIRCNLENRSIAA